MHRTKIICTHSIYMCICLGKWTSFLSKFLLLGPCGFKPYWWRRCLRWESLGSRLLPFLPCERCCKILTTSGPGGQAHPAKGSPEWPPKPAGGLAAGQAPDASQRGPGPGGRPGRCPTPCCGCTWLRPPRPLLQEGCLPGRWESLEMRFQRAGQRF